MTSKRRKVMMIAIWTGTEKWEQEKGTEYYHTVTAKLRMSCSLGHSCE